MPRDHLLMAERGKIHNYGTVMRPKQREFVTRGRYRLTTCAASGTHSTAHPDRGNLNHIA